MNMRILIMLASVFIFGSCSNTKQKQILKLNIPLTTKMENFYKQDKKQIADCFIKNVEYFRKYHHYTHNYDSINKLKEEHYKEYPGADWDPANFFEPYASRFDLEKDKYVNSPIQTKKQLTVTTDTIVYSKDSLFCVAIILIEGKYKELESIETKMRKGREYDAKAIIGYRTNIDEPFDIYPLRKHSVVGFESYKAASVMIRDLYFNKLKGKGGGGGIYRKMHFKQNVGDKDFFEKSPYFKKYDDIFFNFQMYRHLGKDYPYQYLSCKD